MFNWAPNKNRCYGYFLIRPNIDFSDFIEDIKTAERIKERQNKVLEKNQNDFVMNLHKGFKVNISNKEILKEIFTKPIFEYATGIKKDLDVQMIIARIDTVNKCIKNIEEGNFLAKSTITGRHYTALCSLDKFIRNTITTKNGTPLKEFDIKNCQPILLYNLLLNIGDSFNYKDELAALLSLIKEGGLKKYGKTQQCHLLFGNHIYFEKIVKGKIESKDTDKNLIKLYKELEGLCPQIMENIKAISRLNGYKSLVYRLQISGAI